MALARGERVVVVVQVAEQQQTVNPLDVHRELVRLEIGLGRIAELQFPFRWLVCLVNSIRARNWSMMVVGWRRRFQFHSSGSAPVRVQFNFEPVAGLWAMRLWAS